MGLFDWLLGSPRRRRSRTGRAPAARRRASPQRRKVDEQARGRREAAARQKELDRDARRWMQADNKRRRDERQRQERATRLASAERRRYEAGLLRQANRMERSHAREVQQLKRDGWTDAEIKQLLDERWDNPRSRRRNPSTRSALSAAAGALASGGTRRRNPLWADIAKGVVTGLLTEEIKGVRERAAGPVGSLAPPRKNSRRRSAPPTAKRSRKRAAPQHRTRKNPAVVVPNHPDERLQRMSERFHGEPGHVLRLGPDQRRPLPEYVVDVGQEVATVYKPARSSRRGGATWEHSAGDAGDGRPKLSGRRRIVADSRGKTYVVPGSSRMRFDPDQGLVG